MDPPKMDLDRKMGTGLSGRTNFWAAHCDVGASGQTPNCECFAAARDELENRAVHESFSVTGRVGSLYYPLIHHSYPTLSDYIEHMNRYSSLGAEMVAAKGKVRFSVMNIVLRPIATFLYNYFLRLGFLDGREGLLLHLYHATYVSWKYAKAWELSRQESPPKVSS